MRRSVLGILSLVVCIGFSGCRSKPPADSDNTMFDYMQERVGDMAQDGQIAAVGIANSRQSDIAVARAKLNARTQLAQAIQVKIENLEKAFVEEIGEAATSEINELFSSATKQITSQTLQGSVPLEQTFDEDSNGVITAYVLMVQNPEIVDTVLKNNSAQHLYERFRASKAFEELDREIQEFEEAERQGILGM